MAVYTDISNEQLDAFVEDIEIDPAFPGFVAMCRSRGLGITVVSDGIDRTVGATLRRHGLERAVRALSEMTMTTATPAAPRGSP